jgi:hypothetical protein
VPSITLRHKRSRELHIEEFASTGVITDVLFHVLGPLAPSDTHLTSETTNPFRYVAMNPWMVDRPNAKPVPSQDSTT